MPYEPPPELATLSLAEIAEAVAERRLPPVERWTPQAHGDSAMRIARDGRWYHQGSLITRPAMVRAFASLLTRDAEGRHWLVTPHEKLAIEVEDAAFVATDLTVRSAPQGTMLAFRLNTDEFVVAGPNHPLRAAGDPETPALYLAVRHGAEARLNRSTYGQLVDHALEVSEARDLGVESGGTRFPLLPAA